MTTKTKRLLLIAGSILIILVFVFILTRDDSPASSSESQNTDSADQTDQELPTVKQTDPVEQSTDEGEDTSQTTTQPPVNEREALITRADIEGGNVVVKALIQDAQSTDSCKLIVTSTDGSELDARDVTVINQGTFYACDGFSIPVSSYNEYAEIVVQVLIFNDSQQVGSTNETTIQL
jgi:hypothetical protein